MKLLFVDPGTKSGWALFADGVIQSGVWNLKGGRFEGGGMRYLRFQKYLAEALPVDIVGFEEVRRHLGTDAAHIYGGIVGTLSALCEEKSIPYEGIPVGTIKKAVTGKGNSGKELVTAAAKKLFPDQQIADDNQADALAGLYVMMVGNGLVRPK